MAIPGVVYKYADKPCISCEAVFTPYSSQHKFCSTACKGKYKYLTGRVTTDGQYEKISGDWRRYLQRLLYSPGREQLDITDLLRILDKQDYKCALTKEPLTCQLGNGMKFMTNASIDRIRPGEAYSLDNIRLVCRIANVMKWNMSDQELRIWCERILKSA
jgi:hypothetical protein